MSGVEASQPASVRELTGRRLARFRSGDVLVLIAFLMLAAIVICALIPATLAPYPPNQQEITVPAAPVNGALSALLGLESVWLRAVDSPFGSSLLCLARKPDGEAGLR